MNKEFESYINKVTDKICIYGKKEKQIREDLYNSLLERQQATGESDPNVLLGDPDEVAEEFRENLSISNISSKRNKYGYEYVSKTKIFGIPLVHINTKPFGTAKGIIAFGGVSIGVFSFGAISIGIVCFGAISIGILAAFGGAALSGLLSAGGVAISYVLSFGGAAIAKYVAVGGYAKANIAVGGVAKGIVAVFNQYGRGKYMFKLPANADQVLNSIKKVYPNTAQWILNLIKNFI